MNVLVVSPHMDDETIGAGGTLCRYIAQGHHVYWLNIANTKEEYGHDPALVALREQQRLQVAEAYPFSGAYDLKLCPACLKDYRDGDVIPQIQTVMEEVRPEVLILPYGQDIHSDHGVVFRWCLPFTKSFRYPHVKMVLLMEILSETDFCDPAEAFRPNYFVDISAHLERKIQLLKCYGQELGEHPFPRSEDNIRALAHLRGTVAGTQAAESFQLFRCLDK